MLILTLTHLVQNKYQSIPEQHIYNGWMPPSSNQTISHGGKTSGDKPVHLIDEETGSREATCWLWLTQWLITGRGQDRWSHCRQPVWMPGTGENFQTVRAPHPGWDSGARPPAPCLCRLLSGHSAQGQPQSSYSSSGLVCHCPCLNSS